MSRMTNAAVPIHPFPARMAPELVYASLSGLRPCSRVLDPMCGSGTVLRASVEAGFSCVGIDVDPLAVLMSRVWTTPADTEAIRSDARSVVEQARAISEDRLDRIEDEETARYMAYWFGAKQRLALSRLATVLRGRSRPTSDALSVALSRIIVTKEARASLARDASHSRPHKVAESSRFDVFGGFIQSADQLARRLLPDRIRETAKIRLGDARSLDDVPDDAFDVAITSPPYLNAIDYLRGHRLSLVWLGHRISDLRETRAGSVGSERGMAPSRGVLDVSPYVMTTPGARFSARHHGWVTRYASDMQRVLREIGRVVKSGGKVVLVLGNSFLRGAKVDNVKLIVDLAQCAGLALDVQEVREIPARRRYLPPPSTRSGALDSRMRTEAVLTLKCA